MHLSLSENCPSLGDDPHAAVLCVMDASYLEGGVFRRHLGHISGFPAKEILSPQKSLNKGMYAQMIIAMMFAKPFFHP